MDAKVLVRLSQAGRKASILAGGDGAEELTLLVTPDAPEFRAVVEAGAIGPDGVKLDLRYCTWDLHGYGDHIKWDHAPTVAEALADWQRRAAEYMAKKEQDQKQVDEMIARDKAEDAAAIAVWSALPLTERIKRPVANGYAEIVLAKLRRGSTEALAPEAYAEAVAEVERIKGEVDAAKKAKKDADAARRSAWRESLGLEEGDIAIRIEAGALTDVPDDCWQTHKRGKNWLAMISVDPSSPGGLSRNFAAKAKGEFFYLLPDLSPGDPVEFGADYYSGSGRKSPTRWYGFVVKIVHATRLFSEGEADYLVLRECGTGKGACKAGAKFAAENPGPIRQPDEIDAAIVRVNGEGTIVSPPSVN
jgi:hypothetical protein